jgi:hypothetical protein
MVRYPKARPQIVKAKREKLRMPNWKCPWNSLIGDPCGNCQPDTLKETIVCNNNNNNNNNNRHAEEFD